MNISSYRLVTRAIVFHIRRTVILFTNFPFNSLVSQAFIKIEKDKWHYL